MKRYSEKMYGWASILEENTREQACTASQMPFIWPHLALMPDAHLGKGATVGSVIPTVGAIMPAAVGVDIGCGMMAVLTQFTREDVNARPDKLSVVRKRIEELVPVSAGGYNTKLRNTDTRRRVDELANMPGAGDADSVAGNWPMQLGTLGSGNHFIEISLDELDRVWLFLHSGSRGVGNKLAMKHIKIAQEWCKNARIHLPH
jgi:tRNA-splicing ligase RtcB